eukprot:m.44110 g.44110  ORF g.44110 m.44110 type:complete len:172 (+) comp10867_c0_seq1:482-997(+)
MLLNLQNFARLFLKNGEHTWGRDVKSTLTPRAVLRSNWSNDEFHKLVLTSPEYVTLADSWREQRHWGLQAPLQALGSHPLARQIAAAWDALRPQGLPDLTGFTRSLPSTLSPFSCGPDVTITFNRTDGSIQGRTVVFHIVHINNHKHTYFAAYSNVPTASTTPSSRQFTPV